MKQIDDKIFSVISHDLKSPFNSLLGFTQLLKDNYDKYDTAKQKQIIAILHKTTVDAYRLVDNLLLWWRSQRDQLDFRPEKIKLADFIATSIVKLLETAETKEIVVLNEVPEDMTVMADKEMLVAIIYNLVSNAIKYTSKKGEVCIKARKTLTSIEIQVQDNGVGIPEEVRQKLFTFDKKVIRIGTANEKGAGLGLSISKALVEKHKGHIWAEDETTGGTSFYFSIPIDNDSKKLNVKTKSKTMHKPTILIAEDDEANYLLLDTLLSDYDLELEIIHVINGEEAVRVAHDIPDISLVLMDMKMPIMDGYEATKKIKERHPELPIIAQTAYTSREDREKAISAGCDAVISKPIDAEVLYYKIKGLLGQ